MLSRQQVRDFDRRAIEEFGVPALVLLENAGRGAAELLVSLGVHGPVAICCGKGNNGGDGLVMARHLELQGADVFVHLFANPEELSPEAAVHWGIVRKAKIPSRIWDLARLEETDLARKLAKAEWLVDALFGTGLTGAVRPPFERIIALMNQSPGKVFAVDIPSGLDADTGAPMGATIRAKHTATFVAPKKGYDNPAGRTWLGRVHVVGIGAPALLLKESLE